MMKLDAGTMDNHYTVFSVSFYVLETLHSKRYFALHPQEMQTSNATLKAWAGILSLYSFTLKTSAGPQQIDQ